MTHEPLTIDDLATQLGRDRREIEKQAQRGRIPGRKVGGTWQFHPAEIVDWLTNEMRDYSETELESVEQAQQSTEVDADVPLSSLLKPEFVQVPLAARTKRSVLEALIEVAGSTWQVWEPAVVLQAVLAREDVLPTAYAGGVAIPHPRNPLPDALGESIVAFGRTDTGIPFGGATREMTDLFFLVLCRDSRTHLQVLARLGRLLQRPGFLDDLRAVDSNVAAHDVIRTADESAGGITPE